MVHHAVPLDGGGAVVDICPVDGQVVVELAEVGGSAHDAVPQQDDGGQVVDELTEVDGVVGDAVPINGEVVADMVSHGGILGVRHGENLLLGAQSEVVASFGVHLADEVVRPVAPVDICIVGRACPHHKGHKAVGVGGVSLGVVVNRRAVGRALVDVKPDFYGFVVHQFAGAVADHHLVVETFGCLLRKEGAGDGHYGQQCAYSLLHIVKMCLSYYCYSVRVSAPRGFVRQPEQIGSRRESRQVDALLSGHVALRKGLSVGIIQCII